MHVAQPSEAFVPLPDGRPRLPDAPSPRPLGLLGGLGLVSEAAADADVTDVFVAASGLWVDRGSGIRAVHGWSASESEVRDLALTLIARGGRHLDDATPCVDVRLPGGVRVHAVLPPIATRGTVVSIRLPRPLPLGLDDLAQGGMLDADQLGLLQTAVRDRRNILVSGAAGSGKTTLLAALLSAAPASDRIITIEDVAELQIDHPHVVGLEARQANIEGAGELGVQRLVREALRMRPDRLVLGECRGPEVRDLLAALNTGHDGGAGTIHANSLRDLPARLEAVGALAGLSPGAVARQTVSAVDLLIHVGRRPGGGRMVEALGRFALDPADRLTVVPA